ncbi:MAG TPA: VOC family protein [Casimicrobiaceae bacterium]|nr:VOC family protein [Casimicrobiaceae bacterium]
MNDIDSVNHVGMVVRDLTDAAARYEAMGFVLTPFSPHSGAWKPGEAVKPLGSGNRCVMFANNYLEILANADAAAPSQRLAGYLRHHEGAHILCFGSQTLEAVDDRLRTAGIKTSGVIPLQRDVDTEDGVRTARFQRVQFAPDDSPEGYIQAARHLTPEYIYQRRYIVHPNRCSALSNVYFIVDDVLAYAARYERYTDVRASVDGDVATIRLPLIGALTMLTQRRALDVLPGTLRPPIPGIGAVAFHCADLASQRRRLREAGIHAEEADGRMIVPAELANGVAIVFEEER